MKQNPKTYKFLKRQCLVYTGANICLMNDLTECNLI